METRYISLKDAIDTAKFYEAECDPIPRLIDSLNAIPAAAVVEKTEWDKLMFLVDAANQILEAAKWISVKERLPAENSTVIALARDDKMQKVTTCRFGKSHFVLTGRVAYWKVTHWMPLPEPPKEGGGTLES